MPERTTQDYHRPEVDPEVMNAIENALRPEDDITMEAQPDNFLDGALQRAKEKKRRERKSRSKSSSSGGGGASSRDGETSDERRARRAKAKARAPASDGSELPASRGLVKARF
jgi:hypothetical protein